MSCVLIILFLHDFIPLLVILCRFCSQNIVQVKHHHTNSYTGSGIDILCNVPVIPCSAAQCWPMVLSGLDMVGIAQTGSGKTLAVNSMIIYLLLYPYNAVIVVCSPSTGTHSCSTSSETWRGTNSMSTLIC